MTLFGIFKPKNKPIDDFSEKIDRIQNGDIELKDRFIHEYKPFVAACVSKQIKRYVDESCEEYSIGLIAFNDALNYYDKMKNPHFLSFAQLVISRKVINYLESEKKNNRVLPFTYMDEKHGIDFGEQVATDSVQYHFDRYDTREEIQVFVKTLSVYGITLDSLIKSTPKHKDSILLLISIARVIAEDDNLFKKLERKMMIPVSEVVQKIKVSPKTIERNRKYIIAACLAMRSDLEIIKGFLKNLGGGSKS